MKQTKKYNKSRPRIPATVQREVKIEARFACVICTQRVSLIIHHIDENRENNASSNLVYLCSNCHGMVHDGKISAQDLREAKKKVQNDNDILSRFGQELQYLQKSGKISTSGEFNSLRLKYQTTLNDYGDKLIFYQCFIYLIPGFYIDDRGQKIREVIRDFLTIDPEEEQLVLNHLRKLEIIEITGGLVSLKDNTDAKTAATELLEKGKINLSELLTKFDEL